MVFIFVKTCIRHIGQVIFSGYKNKNSFIEFSKDLIDQMHAWHSKEPRKFKITDLTRSIYGLHYYDGVLVIEKGVIEKPFDSKTGHEQVIEYQVSDKEDYSTLKYVV